MSKVITISGRSTSEGAEFSAYNWSDPSDRSHYGYTESDTLRAGYEYVVAEAGIAHLAPRFEDTCFAELFGGSKVEVVIP